MAPTLQVLQSSTRDDGFFRSPDGDELCSILREKCRTGTSLVMLMRDERKVWSQTVDVPGGDLREIDTAASCGQVISTRKQPASV